MTYTPKQERNQGEGALNVATNAPRSDAALTGPAEGLAGITQYATGLLIHAPLSAERQAIIAREAEKEAKAAAFEAEQRRQAALERRWELERQGVVPHSVADVLARASYGMDRADKAEERREREAAEQLGRPEPRVTRWELKREQQQREADAIIEPASKADVSNLSATVSQLKSKLHSLSGRSEQVFPGTARRAESPEEYAQNYGDSSVRFRNGGGIMAARTDMARRPTTADYLAAWRLDSELRGGHHPSDVLQFVSELQDLADARAERALPLGFVSPDVEPWWLTTVRRWFGR